MLTEYLAWRWCLYVNLALRRPGRARRAALLAAQRGRRAAPRIDIPGTLTASAGLFALVYGFSNAETARLGRRRSRSPLLAAGVVLLVAFVAIERRVAHPLLPLRVVLDRNRGGALPRRSRIAGAGMFGVFLFLTYYLQQTLGFSPIETGLAFLPMIAVDHARPARSATTRLLPRFGAAPLVAARHGARRRRRCSCSPARRRLELRHRRPARACSSWASASAWSSPRR